MNHQPITHEQPFSDYHIPAGLLVPDGLNHRHHSNGLEAMKLVKRVGIGLLGLLAIQAAIDAGKARRIQRAREYYQRTGNLEQTVKTYNVTKEEVQ